MSKHYCPNCGAKLKPGAKFCGNCGYRLGPNTPTREDRPINNKPKNKHYGLLIIVLLILIVLLGIGSYYGYDALHSGTQSQTESTEDNLKIPKDTAYKILWHVFRDAQDKVNEGYQNNMPSYFENGSSNSSYKQLKNWANGEENASNLRKVLMQPSIWAVSNDGDYSEVKYHVAYVFKHSDGSKHNQGFMWYAKMAKVNGTWKIISTKASPGPTYDTKS